MNSSDMYIKISKNIFDCLNVNNKDDCIKKELNDNLFLQLSFLTKFISGKNIQENPNFNFFIGNNKKKSIVKNEIDKSILKENESENILDEIKEDDNNNYNLIDDMDKDKDKDIYNQKNEDNILNENEDINNNGRFENITGEIDDKFDLESKRQTMSFSVYNENLNNDNNNNFNQIFEKNNKNNNNTFDISYVSDCSTIFKGNQSFYNPLEDSFLDNKNLNNNNNMNNSYKKKSIPNNNNHNSEYTRFSS
jgi:hypothetical protein